MRCVRTNEWIILEATVFPGSKCCLATHVPVVLPRTQGSFWTGRPSSTIAHNVIKDGSGRLPTKHSQSAVSLTFARPASHPSPRGRCPVASCTTPLTSPELCLNLVRVLGRQWHGRLSYTGYEQSPLDWGNRFALPSTPWTRFSYAFPSLNFPCTFCMRWARLEESMRLLVYDWPRMSVYASPSAAVLFGSGREDEDFCYLMILTNRSKNKIHWFQRSMICPLTFNLRTTNTNEQNQKAHSANNGFVLFLLVLVFPLFLHWCHTFSANGVLN